ncbi:MAG: hypothetical protein ACLFV3_04260 [Phycisphaeraceae bacterium]
MKLWNWAAAAAVLLAAGSVQAGTVASWSFEDPTIPPADATFVDEGLVSGPMSLEMGGGLKSAIEKGWKAPGLATFHWDQSTLADARDAGDYLTFSIAPQTTLNLSSLSIEGWLGSDVSITLQLFAKRADETEYSAVSDAVTAANGDKSFQAVLSILGMESESQAIDFQLAGINSDADPYVGFGPSGEQSLLLTGQAAQAETPPAVVPVPAAVWAGGLVLGLLGVGSTVRRWFVTT